MRERTKGDNREKKLGDANDEPELDGEVAEVGGVVDKHGYILGLLAA